jgi:dynein light intermediate chain 2
VTDKTIVFVGEKKTGKSSLIAKFLDEPVKEEMKETTALEFRYGVRIIEEKKQKVNIYELGRRSSHNDLGGGRILSSLLSAPLNPFNLPNTAVCIAVDLSQPGGVLDSLQFWLNVVRENVQKALEEVTKSSPPMAEQMRAKVDERWEKHEDRTKVNLCLIPIIVLGTKFDIFANQFESVKKKQLCQALR